MKVFGFRMLVLSLVVLGASRAFAQRSSTGALVGRVLDAGSGAPVAGAELLIPSREARATADSAGHYRFAGLAGGVYRLEVRRLGYQQMIMDVSVITGAESESDIRLTRVVTLDTVQTRATAINYISPSLRGFEERRRMGNGYFISEEVMRKNDDRTLGNTLKRIPGIRVSLYQSSEFVASSRRPGSGQAGVLRGGSSSAGTQAVPGRPDSPRGCWVAVYLDGIPVYSGPPSPTPDIGRITVRELAGAEFYQGSASLPVQFSAIKTSDCGVLLLWTRER
jgi:hypothetical protein